MGKFIRDWRWSDITFDLITPLDKEWKPAVSGDTKNGTLDPPHPHPRHLRQVTTPSGTQSPTYQRRGFTGSQDGPTVPSSSDTHHPGGCLQVPGKSQMNVTRRVV